LSDELLKTSDSTELVHGRPELQNDLCFLVFSSSKVNCWDCFVFIVHANRRLQSSGGKGAVTVTRLQNWHSVKLLFGMPLANISDNASAWFFPYTCSSVNYIPKQTRVEKRSEIKHIDHRDYVYNVRIHFGLLHITTRPLQEPVHKT
jgi:hypothetical protein